MLKLLFFLAAGLVTGIVINKQREVTPLFVKAVHYVQMVLLFLILFLMGLNIGRDKEMLADLPALGLQSLVLVIAGVAGSLLFTFLFKKLFKIEITGEEDKE